ncbi:U3 small nucleolar RNA-interacting protein 2 [Frankliniella occidentalis]|uniref:U3 small nucleolar RNA-interacting protein 2 n=1 Tax=Frankliniella occidentalis TaxID=133901 RepID=A0A6J1T0C2_FRAOC|nr:U3 small nucleolar RNA-interacting protein 2 [Frankliniella occidentalis]
MSFFIRNKTSKKSKKEEKQKRTSSEIKKSKRKFEETLTAKEKFSIDDSEEDEEAEGATSSDEDLAETTQEKKLRLAKKYLEEIEKQERERAELQEVDQSVIEGRLKHDLLEQSGRLHKNVADKFIGYDSENIKVLRCKEHNLPITCLAVSADNKFIYSASKDCVIVKWCLVDKKKLKATPNPRKCSADLKQKCHQHRILSLTISTDGKFLAAGDEGNIIHIWNADTLQHMHTFKGHKGPVTGLAFRRDTHQLFSVSTDRAVKLWSLDEMACIETLFGHQSGITAVDALARERAVTSGGRDNSLRVWKIVEESQLVFNGHQGSIDCVRLLDEQHFISGGDDGTLSLWSAMKKKPLCSVVNSHGRDQTTNEANWVSSVASFLNTDLAASGSNNGQIMLWKTGQACRSLVSVFHIPVKGFINGLAFTSDGQYLVAAVGQEHRLGRWWRDPSAKNSVIVIPLKQNPS